MQRSWLLAVVVAVCVSAPGSRARAATGDYLPLGPGARWELRAPNAFAPMVFEVSGREGDSVVVRWDNPWVKASFRFREENGKVLLTGLDMGQGMASMPRDTVYFDFTAPPGATWKNAVGTMRVRSRDARVNSSGTAYRDCIEIETIDTKGQSMFWTFAPGVGFVRFGEGKSAFVLSARSSAHPVPAAASRDNGARDAGGARGFSRAGHLLIGLDANPPESAGLDAHARTAWLEKSLEAGATYIYVSPTWAEFEPASGRYNYEEIDRKADAAAKAGIPLVLNLRVIDTNNRATPKAYSWRFSDERLADRLAAAVSAIASHAKGRVRWFELGNEVDAYFASHGSELADYVALLQRVLPKARAAFPGAAFSVSFTAGAAGSVSRFRPLTDLFDYYAFTYYPLNADFTMRSPDGVEADISRLLSAAGTAPVLIQELGYPSASRLNSSEQKQATFVQNAFASFARHQDRLIGANFLFMADLPSTVVSSLTAYYRSGNAENFKAYLATLGLFDASGRPKPAWQVFQTEAHRLRGAAQ